MENLAAIAGATAFQTLRRARGGWSDSPETRAALSLQTGGLLFFFRPLCQHFQAPAVRHGNDGCDDFHVVTLRRNIVNNQFVARGGLFKFGMQMARQHTQALQAQTLDAATLARFAASVQDSLLAQQKIDGAAQGSFEEFVAQYYA